MIAKVKVTSRPRTESVVKDLDERRKMLVGKRIGEGIPLYHKKASIMLDAWVQRNFKSEGGNLSDGKWQEFAAEGRPRRGFGLDSSAKLLQDTGLLRASHQPFWNKNDAGIGTSLPYAEVHNKGQGVPVRRTVPKDVEVRQALLKLLNQHAERATR